MTFLGSKSALFTALAVAIFTFGVGLTSPIWFLVAGDRPLDAIHAGTPIVMAAIVGLIVSAVIGVIAFQLQKPVQAIARPADDGPLDSFKHKMVHWLVGMLFALPFVAIILGIMLKQVIDADAG